MAKANNETPRETSVSDIDETTLLGGRVRILQPKDGLRAGLDAVMVAAAVPAKPGEAVLDLGCGTGGAGFCVRARVDMRLTGFDIQDNLVALACQSAQLNGWDAHFAAGDLRARDALPSDHFDHVVCNPPYMQAGAWYDTPDPVRSKQLGKQHGDATLADWVACMRRVLKAGGSASVIHRADHADKVIAAMTDGFGAMEIWTLHPHAGEDASRIIIRARKARKSPAVIRPGIVLHQADGAWTEAADAILARGDALE